MWHYIISFTVYMLAMSGLIAFALFIYKKVTTGTALHKNSKILSIEESMMINPRKSLLIVRAGNERFLLASDMDKTSLIAKLDQDKFEALNPDRIQSSPVDLTQIKTTKDNENMDLLFPKKDKTEPFGLKSDKNNENLLHFEVISDKNPNNKAQRKSKGGNVTIEVGKVKNHGLSTIKEIVHKINEI